MPDHTHHRRRFLQTAASITSTFVVGRAAGAAQADANDLKICAFEKFVQDLSYDELADTMRELGFTGIEATVRNKGHVLPERVEEDLPKLVEALRKRDLEITVMASDVRAADEPLTEKVLRTAASLGVATYRMGHLKYDLKRPIDQQVASYRAQLAELADLNRQLGVQGLYQNHSGVGYFGAGLWDLYWAVRDLPVAQLGSAFDIRHASIEAGLNWPTTYHLLKPHIGAVFVKDFQWDGRKAKHVPLGTGRVDPRFFEMLKADDYQGPYSLHVEYLGKEGTQANVDALRRDLAVLRGWL